MAIFGPAEQLNDQWPKGERWEVARDIVLRYLTEGSEEREQAFSRVEGESVKLDVNEGLFLIEEGSALRLEAGDVAIYLPVDGHRPGLSIGSSNLVRKLVVKVRL